MTDECDENLYKYLTAKTTQIEKEKSTDTTPIPANTTNINNDISEESDYPDNIVYLPVVGEIAAGHQHFLEECISGYLPIERSRINSVEPGKYFFLLVDGDSMVGAGIHSGDAVLIRRSSRIKDGAIVAARIGETGTLKTLVETSEGIILQPENLEYEPYQLGYEEFENGSAGFIGEAIARDLIPADTVLEQILDAIP